MDWLTESVLHLNAEQALICMGCRFDFRKFIICLLTAPSFFQDARKKESSAMCLQIPNSGYPGKDVWGAYCDFIRDAYCD